MPKTFRKRQPMSAETKEKMRKAMLGRKFTDEWRKKLSEKAKGRVMSAVTRKKLSDHFKVRYVGENNPRWKGGLKKLKRSGAYKEVLAGRPRSKYCEICGVIGPVCFDHDHKTGKFRGWICKKCNWALGLACDNIKVLQAMIDYLLTHK